MSHQELLTTVIDLRKAALDVVILCDIIVLGSAQDACLATPQLAAHLPVLAARVRRTQSALRKEGGAHV
jgi:hypothetical protein